MPGLTIFCLGIPVCRGGWHLGLRQDPAGSPQRQAESSSSSYGLALRDGELYISDYDAGKVRVLSTATMKEVRSFAAANPGPLAVEADGRVWVIEGKPATEPYLSFYTGGTKIVSHNAKGRLLVGGLNKHCQVWICDVLEKPKKVETFGTEGGIFSGEAGVSGTKKFHWILGLGTDKVGNLYVASVLFNGRIDRVIVGWK